MFLFQQRLLVEEEVKKLREKISDLKVIFFLIENKHITTIANEKKCLKSVHMSNVFGACSSCHNLTTSHQVQISYLRGHVPTSKLHLRRLNNNNNNNNGGNLSGTVTGTATSIASEGDLKMMTVYSF